jgi:hypothetical protein
MDGIYEIIEEEFETFKNEIYIKSASNEIKTYLSSQPRTTNIGFIFIKKFDNIVNSFMEYPRLKTIKVFIDAAAGEFVYWDDDHKRVSVTVSNFLREHLYNAGLISRVEDTIQKNRIIFTKDKHLSKVAYFAFVPRNYIENF